MVKLWKCVLMYCRMEGVICSKLHLSTPFTDTDGELELNITATQDALHVTWHYRWPKCRNYTVHRDNEKVQGCTNIKHMDCTIPNLDPGVKFNVTVVATEDATSPISASKLATTLLGML